jgi:hypothetical protein
MRRIIGKNAFTCCWSDAECRVHAERWKERGAAERCNRGARETKCEHREENREKLTKSAVTNT